MGVSEEIHEGGMYAHWVLTRGSSFETMINSADLISVERALLAADNVDSSIFLQINSRVHKLKLLIRYSNR